MDERWKKMSASIGEPDYDIDEDWPKPGEWTEFWLEVHYSGQMFYCKQLLTTSDLEELTANDLQIEKWIFNEMIKMIDAAIKHWQETGEHREW